MLTDKFKFLETKRFVHVTPKCNINSIMKNGLIPNPPLLHDFGPEAKEVVYSHMLSYEYDTDIKYIRDMIYCKHFIDPVNRWVKNNDNVYTDTPLPDNFEFNYCETEYIVLLISKLPWRYPGIESYEYFVHAQHKDLMNEKYFDFMHDEFSHIEKPLGLYNSVVEPQYLSIIGDGIFIPPLTIKAHIDYRKCNNG